MSKFEEITIGKEDIFHGRVFNVQMDRATLPDGREVTREMVLHNGGACVVPVDRENRIHLVRQWRYPFHTEMLEIPAGKLEIGEDPAECAMRELQEETGLLAKKLIPLGECYAAPAYCSEVLHIYFARDFEKHSQHLDDGEFLEVVRIPFLDAYEMVLDGRIKDSKTQIGILKAACWLKKEE